MAGYGDGPDVTDVFDQILCQDEKSLEAGVQEGEHDGALAGYAEGFCFGWTKGWEIGMEIGFYKGYSRRALDHYATLHSRTGDASPSRKVQTITSLLEILDRINLSNVKADALSDDIVLARRKFKQIFPGIFKSRNDPDTSTSF
ncbi:hypothetical protein BV898_14267 [Hypsibius exemplaris]|uniref:Oral cancer-overexpressed protein 1-like protein n=1 Tax=Hypsibius exemplaris TaxID=2072580 RepID=A0A1W0W894_HYPEX|nr:hypothetical protein BV898_14267 [Hypsibius exemplaris]